MSKRRFDPRQPSLLFEEPPSEPVEAVPADLSEEQEYLQGLKRQVILDMKVLRRPPLYHQPSTEFFEERIRAYRETIEEVERELSR